MAYVFDITEPMRPVVDRAVLGFLKAHTLHAADFVIRSDGVCRFNPEMGRCVVGVVAEAIVKVPPGTP
jgi:hypothetical protein